MGSEQFGPFAIQPAWRRRGPTAEPFALDRKPVDPPTPVEVTSTPVSRAVPVPANQPDYTPLASPRPLELALESAFAPAFVPVEETVPEITEIIAPVRVSPPPPEDVPAPSPFKPDPVPVPPAAARTRRRRRGLRAEALVPYLAAIVGLIALGGAIWLDQQNRERLGVLTGELGAIRTALAQVTARLDAPPAPREDGTIEALLALQERIAKLETAASAAPAPAAAETDAAASPAAPLAAGPGQATGPLKTKLADGPVTDCIPLGTRFVMTPGDVYPICRTPEVVKLQAVTMDGVVLADGKMIGAGGSAAMKFGSCTLTVLTTDINGFAELQATCS